MVVFDNPKLNSFWNHWELFTLISFLNFKNTTMEYTTIYVGVDEKTAPGRAAHAHDGSNTLPRFTDNVTNLSCFQFSFSLGPKLFRIQITKHSPVSSYLSTGRNLVPKKPTVIWCTILRNTSVGCDASKIQIYTAVFRDWWKRQISSVQLVTCFLNFQYMPAEWKRQ